MSDRTTINVSKEAHRIASEAKHEDESWSDYIQRCADTDVLTRGELEEVMNQISMANDPGVVVDTEKILGRLDDLEASLPRKTAEEVHSR